MMTRLTTLMLGIGFSCCVDAANPIYVEADGHVRNSGSQALPAESRLSVAALAASPDSDAYLLGAALLRQSNMHAQTRLKAGLLFDLEALASQHESPELVAAARAMAESFANLPVTGREPQLLDPRGLEASREENRPAKAGDRLIYPARPETVTVTGAVTRSCTLPHSFRSDARAYRQACDVLRVASRDDLYVIQPDGRLQKLGIALWNRGEPVHLAPGAIVFVPLDDKQIKSIAPEINEEAARFLATQVLDAPGASF